MSLRLLCRRQISLQRATVSTGPNGEALRQWRILAANIPATILALRVQGGQGALAMPAPPDRRSMSATHVIMVGAALGADFGDRIFDGTDYYQVRFTINLGDRDQGWAIYTQRLAPQD